MMTTGPEGVTAVYVIKWVLGLVAGGIMLWIRNLHSKINDTYSKEEVEKKIQAEVKPLNRLVEENTEAIKEFRQTNHQLAIVMARVEEQIRGIKGT